MPCSSQNVDVLRDDDGWRLVFAEEHCSSLKTLAASLGCTTSNVIVSFVYAILIRYEGAEKSATIELGFKATAAEEENNQAGDHEYSPVALQCDTQGDISSLLRNIQNGLAKVTKEHSEDDSRGLVDVRIAFNFPREFEKRPSPRRFAVHFEVKHYSDQNEDGFLCALSYTGEGKSDDLPQMFLGNLHRLIHEVSKSQNSNNEDLNVLSLPILAPSEELFLQKYNDTSKAYPRAEYLMHQLFEEKAKETPNAVAIKCENETLTYQQLDERSSILAETILNLVGDNMKNRVVGISVDASIQMIVGLYAIMKAGFAYVPLDPSYPEERLSYMIENSEASLVLAKSEMVKTLKQFCEAVICLDEVMAEIQHDGSVSKIPKPKTNLVKPDDLAYIIYTSGSTGRPKGVMISHRNAVNTLLDMNERYNVTEKDKLLLVASLSFDLSVYDIFGMLATGGCLVIPVPEVRGVPDPACWIATMKREGVTFWDSAPAVLSLLVEYLHSESDCLPPTIRLVILSGDRIPLALPTHLQAMVPDVQVMSQGGATEGSIWSIYYPVKSVDPAWTTIPYGMPLTNQTYFVLDEFLNPVPNLVTGELYIGGVGVAMGYMNNEKVTEFRFLPSSFKENERIYKTGDLGRFHQEGYIEFCGRIDNQVKIRGFRVELSEIESALINQSGVEDALVMKVQEKLVAYVIHDQHAQLKAADLQKQVSEVLPSYMVPAYIVIMDSFPVTVNGKVNRKTLPSIDSISNTNSEKDNKDKDAEEETVIFTKNEEVIATAWCKVLNLNMQQLKSSSSFYEVGGDSISAMTVVSEIKRSGLVLTVQQLLSQPTLGQLALVVKQGKKRKTTNRSDKIASSPQVQLTPAQRWFFEQDFKNQNFWNQSFFLKPQKRVEEEQLSKALNQLVDKHEMLRCHYENKGGTWRQTIQTKGSFNLISKTASTRDELDSFINEIKHSLDITNGPLLAVGLFDFEEEQRVFITVHHLVVDLVSWRIILEDIERLYNNHPTESSTLSFQRWSTYLAEKVSTLSHKSVTSDHELSSLVCDYKTDSIPTAETRKYLSVKVPADITKAVTTSVNDAFRTNTTDVLLSALIMSYNETVGSRTLHVDVEAHGRQPFDGDIDISRTLGWFMTMFPLKLEVVREQSTETTLESTLKRTKEEIRNIPHKGLLFWLIKYLKSSTEKTMPQSDVLFNYYGRFDQIQTKTDFWDTADEYPCGEDEFENDEKLTHKVVVECYLKNDELHLKMFYCTTFLNDCTVDIWLQKWKESLTKISQHCTRVDVHGYTPSDFPLLNLSQSHLDYLLATRLAQLDLQAEQISDMYPCTPMQEGFLFSLLQDQSSYLIQRSCTVKGQIDHLHFKQCVSKVIQRHDILRTRFLVDRINGCMQIVRKVFEPTWTTEDWSSYESNDREVREEKYLTHDRVTGFDISEPMVRFALFKQSNQRHRFIMTVHHSLLDGMSCSLILNEILSAYCNIALPDVPKFRYFVEEVLQFKESAFKSEGFWQEEMHDIPVQGNLRFLPPTLNRRGHDIFIQSFDIVKEVTAYAERNEVSVAAILCASWAFLLNKYSQDPNDVIFGLIVSGRSTSQVDNIDKMVGLTINTLPMRVKIHDHHIAEFVKYVHLKLTTIIEQEKSFMTDIQKWCGHSPNDKLIETALSYQAMENATGFVSNGLAISDIFDHELTEYPLTLDILNTGASIEVKAIYNTNLIDSSALLGVMEHWKHVTMEIVMSKTERVVDLGLTSLEEPEQIDMLQMGKSSKTTDNKINNNQEEVCRVNGVHMLLEEKLKSLPTNHIAIETPTTTTAYEVLNNAANSLANQLRRLGVKREEHVGLILTRDEAMVIGMLGIWKAGCAFVVIDAALPEDRISFMLQDSSCRYAVNATEADIQTLPKDVTVVNLNITDTQNCANPDSVTEESDVAYVVYTSSATGFPNGTLIEHGGLINFLTCKPGGIFNVNKDSRVMQFFAVGFDHFIGEIFSTLCHGGCLVIPPTDFTDCLKTVDTVGITPSTLSVLDSRNYPELTLIVATGEPCPPAIVNIWGKDRTLLNAYGATECSIFTHVGRMEPNSRVTVGKPLVSVKSYIMDSHSKPLPINVIGHLYIAGITVARGYHNRPDLSDEVFVENPVDGGYMFKTGDLGRMLESGDLEILGRTDSQVKLRGRRVDLEEIKSTLEQYPDVKHAHVLVQDDQFIVAYAVTMNEVGESEIIERLRKHLPNFMIPTTVFCMTSLPLSVARTVDVASLPKFVPTITQDDSRKPQNDLEALILKSYKEVVDPNFTMDSNFFSLGGHSLLAITLKSVLVENLGQEVSMTDIMKYATPTQLASELSSRMLVPRKIKKTKSTMSKTCPQDDTLVKAVTSYHQEQMCLLYEVIQESPVYNVAVIMTFTGNLNVEILKKSLLQLSMNHQAFRTSFISEGENAFYQVVRPNTESILDFVYYEEIHEQLEAQEIIYDEAAKPFDLYECPLARFRLVKLCNDEHKMLLLMHHAVTDGASVRVIIDQMSEYYHCLLNDLHPKIPQQYINYVDYSNWERKSLDGGKMESQLSFWKQLLESAQPVLDLPLDRPRPAVPSYDGASVFFNIPGHVTKKLMSLSLECGGTLFNALTAVYASLIRIYCQADDIVLGAFFSGRHNPGTEDIIGYFVNTLPLRVRFDKNLSFKQLLKDIKVLMFDVLDNQDVPFQKVLEALSIPRDTAYHPIVQVATILQEGVACKQIANDLTMEVQAFDQFTAKFDLNLEFLRQPNGSLSGQFVFNTDIFNRSTVERMSNHLLHLLDLFSVNSDVAMNKLSLMPPTELESILAFNTVAECSQIRIHQQFELKAIALPSQIAVEEHGRTITYGRLNEAANALMGKLRPMGVGVDVPVALVSERTIELIASILGTLKSDGAFLCIDATLPQSRIDYMLEDSECKIVVTTENITKSGMLKHFRGEIVLIDVNEYTTKYSTTSTSSDVSEEWQQQPVGVAGPQNMAYIVYTSGTTGQPKGVMVTHKGVENLIPKMNEIHSITAGRRMTQFFNIMFDGAYQEIFMALISGATLVLREENYINTLKTVDFSMMTPTVLASLDPEDFPNLKTVSVLGEILPEAVVAKWKNHVELFNEYGPCEVTINCTVGQMNDLENVTVGKPVANTPVYVLGDNMKPLPVGVKGTIYISGFGVAKGYIKRPDLTLQKFIKNPFGDDVLYNSGDLGCWTESGELIVYGRKDRQVKLRGFRVELGEVEHALCVQDGVTNAAVVKNKDILVGYVTPDIGTSKAQQLRLKLEETLPRFMVPAVIVPMEKFPMSTAEKVNYRALPEPTLAQQETFTKKERVLIQIWSEVLGIDSSKLKSTDSFFYLGGDSISAMKVFSSARKQNLRFTVQQIFQTRNLAQLAAVAKFEKKSSGREYAEVVGTIPLTPIQEWFMGLELQNRNHFNQSIMLEPRKPIDVNTLQKAIDGILSHHDMLRVQYTFLDDKTAIQELKPLSDSMKPILVIKSLSTEQVSDEIAKIQTSLSLTDGSILGFGLFDVQGKGQLLFITVHHMAVDLVSWQCLLEDFESLYLGETLQSKTTSFKQWSESLAFSYGTTLSTSSWPATHSEATSNLDDFLYKGISGCSSTRQIKTASVDKETTAKLLHLQGTHGSELISVNDVLLTALMMSYYQCTGEASLSVEQEWYGRESWDNKMDVSRTVGWFTVMYPAMLTTDGDTDVKKQLGQIKSILSNIPQQGLPYGVLKYLKKDTDKRFHEQCDILYNYHGSANQFSKDLKLWDVCTDGDFIYNNRDKNEKLSNSLVIECDIKESCLHAFFIYMRDDESEFINELVSKWAQLVKDIMEHVPIDVTAESVTEMSATLITDNADVEDIFQCTPLQEGFIFSLLQDRSSYLVQNAMDIEGTLDVDRFKAAWQQVTDRHQSLRTTFAIEPKTDTLRQVVRRRVTPQWELCDWQDQEESFVSSDRTRGFDMHDVMMRFALMKSTDDKYRFIWTFHHALVDGWSALLVLKEVLKLYHSMELLAPPPFRYFVEYCQSQNMWAAQNFWNDYFEQMTLKQSVCLYETSTETEPIDIQHFEKQFTISSKKLNQFARNDNLTMSSIIFGAWAMVLDRFSNSSGNDLVFGVVLASRSAEIEAIEDMVGLLINTLPLRITMPTGSDVTLIDWLYSIQSRQSSIMSYDFCSLADVIKWSGIKRSQNLFDTMIIFENYPLFDNVDDAEIKFSNPSGYEKIQLPMSLLLSAEGEYLAVKCMFDRTKIGEDVVHHMLDLMDYSLQQIIRSEMTRPITDFDINSMAVPNSIANYVNSEVIYSIKDQMGRHCPIGLPGLLHVRMQDDRELDTEVVAKQSSEGDLSVLVDSELLNTYNEIWQAGDCFVHEVKGTTLAFAAKSLLDKTTAEEIKTHLEKKFSHILVVPVDNIISVHGWKLDLITKQQQDKAVATVASVKENRAIVTKLTEKQITLRQIWAHLLGMKTEDIKVDHSFFDLGGTSIKAISMVSLAEKRGLMLSLTDVLENETLAELSEVAAKKLGDDDVLVRLNVGDKRNIPIICVHASDGGTSPYAYVAGNMKKHPMYAFRFLLNTRFESIEQLASSYIDRMGQLEFIEKQSPFILVGYSTGGALAFEMGLQLQRVNKSPERLVLIDGTPDLTKNTYAPIISSSEERFSEILEGVKNTWNEKGLDKEDLKLALAIFRGTMHRYATYVPQSLYKGSAVLLRAKDTLESGPLAAAIKTLETEREDYGLQRHCSSDVHVVEVDGDHYTMMRDSDRMLTRAIIGEL